MDTMTAVQLKAFCKRLGWAMPPRPDTAQARTFVKSRVGESIYHIVASDLGSVRRPCISVLHGNISLI